MPSPRASLAAHRLSLAATPAFALMALLTSDAGSMHAMPHGASPISGMALMYTLMSIFHMPPWLKLVAARHEKGAG